MDLTKEYSEKELSLIRKLGFENLLSNIDPVSLYKVMAEDLFVNNRHSDAVDSVRRCLKAINKANPYRMTPEFDALIKFKD